MNLQGFAFLLVLLLMCPTNIIGLWWAVGSPLVMDPNRICKKSERIGGKQREICLNERDIVREIANGARLAIGECRYQFANRQWDCPTKQRGIAKVLKLDTRETGFVNAITAAGVVYAVTEACTMGLLVQCTCDLSRDLKDIKMDGQWEWGGCGDDVTFGYLKSRDFMDIVKKRRKRSDIRTKLNLHNNEAGRLAVKENMRTECKCHGLSGSCTLKTCWRKMPLFRDVGGKLRHRFDSASKVTISNNGLRLVPLGGRTRKSYSELDIVYSSESPDYCIFNRKLGSPGTEGRICDPESQGLGSCDLLCCGRGFRQDRVTKYENCQCVFKWCCEVICKTCIRDATVFRCN